MTEENTQISTDLEDVSNNSKLHIFYLFIEMDSFLIQYTLFIVSLPSAPPSSSPHPLPSGSQPLITKQHLNLTK